MLELEILYLWFSMIIGLTIIFQSWAKDPIIFQNRLKPKYSAYITLFAPVVIALAIPIFWVWTIWNVCNGIMETVCTCNSKLNIHLTDFMVPYVYGSIKCQNIYKLKTAAYVFSCNNCSAIWNNKETLAYQLNECLEWVDRMLPILMNEVSLKVAVLRGKDYLANGYYCHGCKVIPPKLDELLFSEISQLIETVVADIYWDCPPISIGRI